MFWTALGLGALINAPGTTGYRGASRSRRGQRQRMRSLSAALLRSNAQSQYVCEDREAVEMESDLNFDLPPFPQAAFEELGQLQLDHSRRRQEKADELRNYITERKQAYYREHKCLCQEEGGVLKLQLDGAGCWQIADGGENRQECMAREIAESAHFQDLVHGHDAEREEFVRVQGDKVEGFLGAAWDHLQESQVREGVLDMIQNVLNAALKLTQRQEDELWLCDIPEDTLKNEVRSRLSELHSLEDSFSEEQRECEPLGTLISYEMEVTDIIFKRKVEFCQKRREEFFLHVRDIYADGGMHTDFAEVLPGFITDIVHMLGVYNINR